MKCCARWNDGIRASWIGTVAVLIFMLVSGSGFAVTLAGQQQPCSQACTIQAGKTFSVLFDAPAVSADAGPPTGFRLYINDVKVGPDIVASAGTTTIPGQSILTPGTHTIQVTAFNASGESAKTPPLQLTVTVALPGPPTNLRILVAFTVAQDGKVGMKIVGVEAVP